MECGPGGGKRKRSKQSHLRSPPPQPAPRPRRRQSTPSSPPKPAPTVVGPNCVSSPRTSSKSNRSSPAKCCSCSKGGARGATEATGVAALAISVERLGPAEKSRNCRSRTAATASLPGVTQTRVSFRQQPNWPRPRGPATPPPRPCLLHCPRSGLTRKGLSE